MAKNKTNTKIQGLQYSKSKSYAYLSCFGISSLAHETPIESNIILPDQHSLKQKSRKNNRWFPWQNLGLLVKSQGTKMMPLEGSKPDEKEKLKLKHRAKASKVHHHSSKWRTKSNLHRPSPPVKPNKNPSQSQTPHQNRENNSVGIDTCQQSISPPTKYAANALSHAVSRTTSKRHVQRLSSSSQVQPQTTMKQPRHKQHQNAKRHDHVVGTSVVMVTLIIMILWGRLCAIVCTSVWLYFVPRLRFMDKNDVVENATNSSNYLDLDSEVYKKRVVLEGLLQRKHSVFP